MWALYLLARHPHIQHQVHEEVDKFFGECLAHGVQGHFAQTPFCRFVFVLFTRTTKYKLSYDIHAMEKIFFMLHLDFSSQCTVRDFVNTDVRMNAVLFTYS